MPFLTNLIDDKSPLILYDDTWIPGTSADSSAMDYYLGTYTVNNVTDATATFNFNGTQIWLYGAHRGNHGTYTIQLDSASYLNLNSGRADAFQQSLFNTSISQGSHTLKLTNTGSGNTPYIDIDLIVWQSEIGNTSDQLVYELVQDTDSRFQYEEPAWTTSPPSSKTNFNFFYNGTGHSASTYGASVTFTFTVGEAISLYGTSGPDNGLYSVQLDGGQGVTYNATNISPTNYAVMIYYADNLGSGSHQLVFTNLPASAGQSLSIDYAELWTTTNTSTTSVSPNSASSINTSQKTLNSGLIAGIAIAAAVVVLCAGGVIFFYRRWKAAMVTQRGLYRVSTPPQQLPESTVVAATGFSPFPETGNVSNPLQNGASTYTTLGISHSPANNYEVQYDGGIGILAGSRDSGDDTIGSPTLPPTTDEVLGRRPFPGASGGGPLLPAEFPKFTNTTVRRELSMTTVDHTSEAPPNYNQAIGNAGHLDE